MRIWLHCIKSAGMRKLLYSPDTDVYHIGLPLLSQQYPQPDVFIQLQGRQKESQRYLHLKSFLEALLCDPDLAQVPQPQRASILQSAYIATGCDYISFFKNIGKCFFLKVLFQYAKFITGGSNPPGSLACVSQEDSILEKLAFMRLVGCAYFKKHLPGFKHSTPVALFWSIAAPTPEQHHKDEGHLVPSCEALLLHWKRSTWIATYWQKSTHHNIRMPGTDSS